MYSVPVCNPITSESEVLTEAVKQISSEDADNSCQSKVGRKRKLMATADKAFKHSYVRRQLRKPNKFL